MDENKTLNGWLSLPYKSFSRESFLFTSPEKDASTHAIHCDCSGLINLLFDELKIPKPYQIDRPKAVHYYSVLQEIGSNRLDDLDAGHLLAWRKEYLPKTGDTGHVLIVANKPRLLEENRFQVTVFDSTKKKNGLSKRDIEIYTNKQGQIIGVRLHSDENKVKRTPIYHQSITRSRFCFGCGLPKKVCGCGKITPIVKTPNIVILRHPKERKRTLSTVSLIKQRYPNVLVKDGEVFPPLRFKNIALLFPTNNSNKNYDSSEITTEDKILILVDATWRKAKKIIHLNPWLKNIPRVSILPENISNYLIRKISNEYELSSVETFSAIMEDKELTHMFIEFMEQQILLIGENTYSNNYQSHLNYSTRKNKGENNS